MRMYTYGTRTRTRTGTYNRGARETMDGGVIRGAIGVTRGAFRNARKWRILANLEDRDECEPFINLGASPNGRPTNIGE
jgi:hypothetical protein